MFITSKRNKPKQGFTLVEILIVVAVIALLATIAMPNWLRSRRQANDAGAQGALRTIGTALEMYSVRHGVYPTNTGDLTGPVPPYLNIDYFTGTHHGFSFTADYLTTTAYSATAVPVDSNAGSGSFTITTGGVLVEN